MAAGKLTGKLVELVLRSKHAEKAQSFGQQPLSSLPEKEPASCAPERSIPGGSLERELAQGGFRLGTPQRSGAMTVAPLFGPDHQGRFAPPLTGLKLSRVRGYGNVELENASSEGIAIVPLHIGYIQHGAQNHALCRSAFIGPGQKLMFHDACCVQAAQGGYLEGREQWFFILPLALRETALELRGIESYGKLWDAISNLNMKHGLKARGHLEQIIGGQRPYLTQYQSRFELLPGQTGALFLIRDKLAGIEIAPTAEYFQEVWMPLVSFCYGSAAMEEELTTAETGGRADPFDAQNLDELKERLAESRLQVQAEIGQVLARTPYEKIQRDEEERFLELSLVTLNGSHFVGQCVEESGELIYASVTAKAHYMYGNT